MSSFHGYLDGIEGFVVKGWAANREDQDHCAIIDIYVDDARILQLPCTCYRGDLESAGIRSGFAGFVFEIPAAFRDGEPHSLDLRFSETGLSLENATTTFQHGHQADASLQERERWAARNLVYQAPSPMRLAESLRRTRKLAIISTYHEASAHLRYHRALFEGLSEAGFTVLIVHAADRHRPGLNSVNIDECFTILKRNIGYDFGSYAVGLFAACDSLAEVDELIFVNDSVLQIGDGLRAMIDRFREVDADAVACTDSFEHQYHLQSYLIWFGRKICATSVLPRFMADYSFSSVKDVVIKEGEIGLSARLQAEGFTIAALFSYQTLASSWVRRYAETLQQVDDLPGAPRDQTTPSFKKALYNQLDLMMNSIVNGIPLNPTHFFWDILIEDFDFPFIKRELAITNPCNVPTYFKLGTYFSAGSDAMAALMEIRQLYGGTLIPLAISHRQLLAPERSAADFRPPQRKTVPLHLSVKDQQDPVALQTRTKPSNLDATYPALSG